jgi:7-cyano-7-deazaguanine synthase
MVVLASGGINSAVLLAQAVADHKNPTALFVDYGQEAWVREGRAVERIGKFLSVPTEHVTVNIPSWVNPEQDGPPGRNLVLIGIAAVYAARQTGDRIIHIGHMLDNPERVVDCRRAFVLSAIRAIWDMDLGIQVFAPLLDQTKIDVVAQARQLGVLDLAWSCYRGSVRPCGECLSCRQRIAAGG